VQFSKASWTAPVSNDPVTITFKQLVKNTDALRHRQLQQDPHVHAVDNDAVNKAAGGAPRGVARADSGDERRFAAPDSDERPSARACPRARDA